MTITIITWFILSFYLLFTPENDKKTPVVKEEAKIEKQMAESTIDAAVAFEQIVEDIYTAAGLEEKNLKYSTFKTAATGFYSMKAKGLIKKDILTLVDFEKASTEKRFYVIDMKNKKVLYYDLVSHGTNTGWNYAEDFSNVPESRKSSIGFYLTAETYYGKHGLSLRLDGLDKGYNDNARKRAIVMHGANYCSIGYAKKNGRNGRSWGCPAIPMTIYKDVIHDIKEGSALFVYHPNEQYLKSSKYLNEQIAQAQVLKELGEQVALK